MTLLIEPNIAQNLSIMAKSALMKMSEEQQMMFSEDFKRKRKSLTSAYLLLLLSPIATFIYFGKTGLLLIFLLVTLVTVGVGGVIWYIVEVFLLPKRVRHYNEELAIRVLRDQKLLATL